MSGWVIAAGVAILAGLCLWIWAVRRDGSGPDPAAAYLIGDQIAGGHHRHHSGDSGWGDSGGADAGGGADA